MKIYFTKSVIFLLVAVGFVLSSGNKAKGQIIATFAGNGTSVSSGDGGYCTASGLNYPFDVCTDDSSNVYITDVFNDCIRKVNAITGIITTVAGNGTPGFSGDGGAATNAQLYQPEGIAVDTAGNLYIGDSYNNRIRKVTKSTGLISTIAGNGGSGFSGDGGPATNASFSIIIGVAVDDTGNVYIVDHYNGRIRKVTVATGIIQTIAGSGSNSGTDGVGDGGPATGAQFNQPDGIAIDDSNNVYIADQWNNRIRKIFAKSDSVICVAGNGSFGYLGDGGQATAAGLDICSGVAVDIVGNIYIADSYNNEIRKVTKSTGVITTIAGIYDSQYQGTGNGTYSGDDGPATAAELNQPYGVAVDGCGNVFSAETNSNGQIDNRIRIIYTPDSVKVTPNPASTCNGGTITLKASGANYYSWSPAIGLNATTGDSVIANPTAVTTYTVTGGNGCAGGVTFVSTNVVVTIDSAGPLDIEPQSPVLCDGSVVKLYVTAGGNGSFTWSPSSSLSASTGDTVIANPTADVTYTVSGAASGGCASTGTDVVTVVAAPNKPTIGKSANGDTLISSATQGNQWYYNDTLINGATNQTVIITGQKTGSYTVQVINPANGCSSTSDSLIASDINRLASFNNQLAVYPNPTIGKVFITVNSSVQDLNGWQLEIADVLGRILYKQPSLSYSNEIDLSDFPGGVYFIRIENKTGLDVSPLIKQN